MCLQVLLVSSLGSDVFKFSLVSLQLINSIEETLHALTAARGGEEATGRRLKGRIEAAGSSSHKMCKLDSAIVECLSSLLFPVGWSTSGMSKANCILFSTEITEELLIITLRACDSRLSL